jgi:hypothetical protein
MPIGERIRNVATRLRAAGFVKSARIFRDAERANVAMIFALSLVPLTAAAGAGLDLARGMLVHSELLSALDGAALAVGGTPGLTQSQMTTLAQQYFNANYKVDASYGTPTPVTVTVVGQSIKVAATDPMPTTLMSVVGYRTFNVAASSTVVWGQQKLWVSLVLDNTGSMAQSDAKTGTTKLSALKTATHSLLTMLQGVATNPGDVQVSITPFARDVKIATSNSSQTWLSWTDWLAAPSSAPSTSIGPGSTCPFSDDDEGFHCQATPTNGSATAKTIPNSGTYKGYICPSDNNVGHYYNGCWTSTASGSKYNHTWVANNKSTWIGCVTDRSQSYDVTNTTPTTATAATLMVAENSPSCTSTQAAMMGLSYNWTTLSGEVDDMEAVGATNQTVGLFWGWMTQNQGVPYSATALPANTQRIMILLSDGLNTQDRWYGDGSNQSSQVDGRMALACTNAKTFGFTIYTVFVDLNGTQGNSTVLQNCASDSTKYFDLTSADQIVSTFNAIGEQITNLRVSQ